MNRQIRAAEVLDRNFLEMRCKLIEVAAAMDRVGRSEGAAAVVEDPRMSRLRDAIAALGGEGSGRAEKLQMIFSLDYEAEWRHGR